MHFQRDANAVASKLGRSYRDFKYCAKNLLGCNPRPGIVGPGMLKPIYLAECAHYFVCFKPPCLVCFSENFFLIENCFQSV